MSQRTISRGPLIAFWIAVTSSHAQEFDPRDPSIIAEELSRANLVVVGTFGVDWHYPWIDGWHYSGSLHVDEVLFGDRKPHDPIPFRWLEKYGISCLICDRISDFKGKSGVWFLSAKNGEWQFSGTMARVCGGPSPLDTRKTLIEAVQERKPKD